MSMSMHRRDKDAFLDTDSVWRWTSIVHEDDTNKMTLRTPCCQDQLVVGSDCFETGVAYWLGDGDDRPAAGDCDVMACGWQHLRSTLAAGD